MIGKYKKIINNNEKKYISAKDALKLENWEQHILNR